MSNFIGPRGGATRFKIAQAPGSIMMWPHKDGKYAPYETEKIERLREDRQGLEIDLSAATQRIEELEAHYNEQVCLKCMHTQGHHITNDRIDAAVEYAEARWTRTPNSTPWNALNKLNIYRCEGCGGNPDLCEGSENRKRCPDCNGHGWTHE